MTPDGRRPIRRRLLIRHLVRYQLFPVRSSQEQAPQVPAAGRSTYLPNTYGLELEGTYGVRYHRGGQMNWPLFPGSMLRRPANFSVTYAGTYLPSLPYSYPYLTLDKRGGEVSLPTLTLPLPRLSHEEKKLSLSLTLTFAIAQQAPNEDSSLVSHERSATAQMSGPRLARQPPHPYDLPQTLPIYLEKGSRVRS